MTGSMPRSSSVSVSISKLNLFILTTREILKAHRVCVVVPTYNNATTIVDVLERILAVADDVVVVADGCTDDTLQRLAPFEKRIDIVNYTPNRGKGTALIEGFARAIRQGFEYALTIDSDGQHFPEDIPLFAQALDNHPQTLIVGARNLEQENMPGGNTFANRFSNFWFTVQTGRRLPDTQTGYRLYPLRRLSGLRWITSRYEAELELLVLMTWSGTDVVSVPVRVYYPPQGERVTHFRPVADFARISLLNTVLCVVAVVYGWPRTIIRKIRGK